VLFTDGRANVPFGDGDPWQQSLEHAQKLVGVIAGAVVIDCETGLVRLERAALLAEKLGAECVALDQLDAAGLTLRLQRRLSGS
jgi:magnesium chelatase subunit D